MDDFVVAALLDSDSVSVSDESAAIVDVIVYYGIMMIDVGAARASADQGNAVLAVAANQVAVYNNSLGVICNYYACYSGIFNLAVADRAILCAAD